MFLEVFHKIFFSGIFFELLKKTLLSILPYVVTAPLMGVVLLPCIFGLADGFGIILRKDKKIKCWVYLSLLIFMFLVIVEGSVSGTF